VLAVVGIGITIVVYGAVALIVKADDAGIALAQTGSAPLRALGRGIVFGMPYFLQALAIIGTAAMVWVGGGIIVHGLEEYGLGGIADALHAGSDAAAAAMPAIGGLAAWFVTALGSGLLGLVLGAALVPVVEKLVIPAWQRLRPGA